MNGMAERSSIQCIEVVHLAGEASSNATQMKTLVP